MKKIKSLGLMLVLSIVMVGNIFATGPVIAGTAGAAPGLFTLVLEQVLSAFGGESCPFRICQNCRPNGEGGDNGNGDCRPRDN